MSRRFDIRYSADDLAEIRRRISEAGEVPNNDVGAAGEPLTIGEWKVWIDDLVDNPREDVIWNVSTPRTGGREHARAPS